MSTSKAPVLHLACRYLSCGCISFICQCREILRDHAGQDARLAALLYMLQRLLDAPGVMMAEYSWLIVIPIMKMLQGPEPAVRSRATAAFADVVALLPLAKVCRLCLLMPKCPQHVSTRPVCHPFSTAAVLSFYCQRMVLLPMLTQSLQTRLSKALPILGLLS